MFRIMILLPVIFVQLTCKGPPEKPDPPLTLFKFLVEPPVNVNEDATSQPSVTNPSYNSNRISDTGQTLCYTNAGGVTACLNTGQDGEFNDIPSQRSFTGPTQHSQYTNDYTTLDNNRGLVWKTCPEGQTGPTCAGAATPFSWNTASLGGPGTCNALNAQNGGNGYARRTNWRIPTAKELLSIYHYMNAPAHMETAPFPNADQSNVYLTNTDYPLNTTMEWVVDFINSPPIQPFVKGANGLLRCVSGTPESAFNFTDNGNGTVTDRNTNLLWSKCPFGKSNTTCLAGVLFSGNRNSALANCNGLVLAGRSDWRLPNVNELLSIVDYAGAGNPAIQTATFPNFPSALFWTSTSDINALTTSIVINFGGGGTLTTTAKTNPASAICVATAQ
ncbi:DUF1566 domain-containing protein [Leptospira sp. 201903071]|uniref:Lcl C-terminal domain-containing protein n=1 Tax=Leptospira ainazelensis TaxID=2810034 RepID=UPI001962397B|nr:DUF1566 domain-containing protein [Leptospira ainazelensis]MBM9499125.1 DUF1566 domain-containing protein [Leptospira ainazelensis]